MEAFRCASFSPRLQSRNALIRNTLGSSTTASHRKYGNARSHSAHGNGILCRTAPTVNRRGEYPPIYRTCVYYSTGNSGGLPRLSAGRRRLVDALLRSRAGPPGHRPSRRRKAPTTSICAPWPPVSSRTLDEKRFSIWRSQPPKVRFVKRAASRAAECSS